LTEGIRIKMKIGGGEGEKDPILTGLIGEFPDPIFLI
jgi:hypothetical protein